MVAEELVELDGPVGRCSSTAAIDIGRRLAERRDGDARLYSVTAGEGIERDGTATRWELTFDLPDRMATLLVVVTFTFDESTRAFGTGVAALVETSFPAPGSELERMAVSRGMSRRRVRGIWRQTMAGHQMLNDPVPDAGEVLGILRSSDRDVGELRSLEASRSRSGIPRWIATGRRGRRQIQWSVTTDGRFDYQL